MIFDGAAAWLGNYGVDSSAIVERLNARGVGNFKLCKFSHDRWVLEMESVEEKRNVLKKDPEWFQQSFTFVHPWKEDDRSISRAAWISI